MIKGVKNLKVTTVIIIMSLLAVISTAAVGTMGELSVRKINNNASQMYNDRVEPLGVVSGIRGEFLNIRILVNKAFIKYDEKYDGAIKTHNDKINKYISQYLSHNIDSEEQKEIESFKASYEKYLEKWGSINSLLSSGQSADKEYDETSTLGSQLEDILFNLKEYNLKEAKELNNTSIAIYESTNKVLIILLLSVIVIFIVIAYLVMRLISRSSKELIRDLQVLTTGDFSIKLETESKNEFGKMRNTVAEMIKDISGIIKTVKESSEIISNQTETLFSVAEEMASSSENVSSAVQDVAKGTGAQSEELVDMSTVFNKFGEEINRIAISIGEIQSSSNEIGHMTSKSNEKIGNLLASISNIGKSFKELYSRVSSLTGRISKIDEITNLINTISGQTNLLALNAAIEAARAGEQGKGFAVVAEEIRKLAQQSKSSSENIKALVEAISEDSKLMINTTENMSMEMSAQEKVVGSTLQSFNNIIEAIEAMNPKIKLVNSSVISISDEKNVILQKIEQISAVAQEVSASTEEISASMEEVNASSEEVSSSAELLNDMTSKMIEQVNKFRI